MEQFRPQDIDFKPATLEDTSLPDQENEAKQVVQYEGAFDRQKVSNLLRLKAEGYAGYEEEEKSFNEFITLQLLTMLGERFNRGKSEFSYRTVDEKLVGEHDTEPLESVFERGRAYREIHGNYQDRAREQAEVDGFRKVQATMLDENTPEGAMMISISPPGGEGSTYQHNFFDLYQKKTDGVVEAVRYSSALSVEETMNKLFDLSVEASFPIVFPEDWSDAGLLANPILLDTNLSVDQVYRKLHIDHEIMSDEKFNDVKMGVNALITSYIACLKAEPENIWKHNLHLNAILNAADLIKVREYEKANERVYGYTESDVDILGRAPVAAVNTGCGYSGGFSVMSGESALGAFGVGSFAHPENDPNLCRCNGKSPHFHCPGTKEVSAKDTKSGKESKKKEPCSFAITVGKGISRCPDCGEGKRC